METTNAILRPIQPGDNAQVANIIRRVMTEYGAVGPGFSIMDPEVDVMYETYATQRSAFFVIVQEDGLIKGCGGIAPLQGGDEDTCELKKMYFLPELRGQGWGKKMIEACLFAAFQCGFRYCYLETLQNMTEANKLYQSRGFERIPGPLGNTGHGGCNTFYRIALDNMDK